MLFIGLGSLKMRPDIKTQEYPFNLVFTSLSFQIHFDFHQRLCELFVKLLQVTQGKRQQNCNFELLSPKFNVNSVNVNKLLSA